MLCHSDELNQNRGSTAEGNTCDDLLIYMFCYRFKVQDAIVAIEPTPSNTLADYTKDGNGGGNGGIGGNDSVQRLAPIRLRRYRHILFLKWINVDMFQIRSNSILEAKQTNCHVLELAFEFVARTPLRTCEHLDRAVDLH